MINSEIKFLPAWAALASATFAQLSSPTAVDGPETVGLYQWSAKPTEPPNLELVKRRLGVAGLVKREGELLGYIAGSNTCGYLDQNAEVPYTCSYGHTCAVLEGPPNLQGCCDSAQCGGFYFTCIPLASTALCDAACQSDTFTLQCTNAANPYCGSYTYPELDATLYNCIESQWPASLPAQIYTEASGDIDQILFTPIYNTSTAGGAGGATTAQSSNITPIIFQSSKTPSSTTTTTPTPPATSSVSPSHSSTPVGAIVGGIVGGLAVVGAVIAGVVFLCLRKSRNAGQQGPGNVQGGVPVGAPPQYMSPQPNQMVDNRYSVVSAPAPDYMQQQAYYNKGAYGMVSPTATSPTEYSPPTGQAFPQQTPHPQQVHYQQQYPTPVGQVAPHPVIGGQPMYEVQG